MFTHKQVLMVLYILTDINFTCYVSKYVNAGSYFMYKLAAMVCYINIVPMTAL